MGDMSKVKAPKDLFSQVNNTLVSIQKSKSNADLKLKEELVRSKSNTIITETITDSKSETVEAKEMNKNLTSKVSQNNKQTHLEVKKIMPDISEIESNMPVVSPLEQKRQAEREKMERLKMSKKLDEVFGVIRS